MPVPLEVDDRYQTAVLWLCTGVGTDGRPMLGSPQEITVRWSWIKEEITLPNGNVVGLESRVTLDREVAESSLLWLGTLLQWDVAEENPGNELQEVIKMQKVWDLKARSPRYIASTARYRDAVPS